MYNVWQGKKIIKSCESYREAVRLSQVNTRRRVVWVPMH